MRPKTCFCAPHFAVCDDAVKAVARETAGLQGLAIVLGHPQALSADAAAFSVCRNAASVVRNGQIEQTYFKRELPNYQVFDERRYFVAGRNRACLKWLECGWVLICEDAWYPAAARDAAAAGAEVLAVINASPFHLGKSAERANHAGARGGDGFALLYAHLVGGQDEVVFTPVARCFGADGRAAGRAPGFKENLFTVRLQQAQGAIELIADGPRAQRLMQTCGTRWCWACATMSPRMASPACCWVCPAALIRPWCWRLR